jgi:heme A synthase
MQTTVHERTHEARTYEYFQPDQAVPARRGSDQVKLYRRFSRLLAIFTAIAILLGAVVAALSAYSTNLEVISLQTRNEIQKVDERMRELKTGIEKDYNNVLINTPIQVEENANLADNSYFVRDVWDVGG